jgi:hypothetical protein
MDSRKKTAGPQWPSLSFSSINQLGQHFLRSGPRWYPGGQALPSYIGWHAPPGPRQKPRPQPSATLTTGVLETPTGAGVTAALAAVERPSAKAVPKKIVRIILYLPLLEISRNDSPNGSENQAGP